MIQTANLIDEVLRLEDGKYASMVRGDINALADLYSEDLAYTHSSGVCHDKAGYLATMHSAEYRYTAIRPGERKIISIDEAVVITGYIELDVIFLSGARTLKSQFMSVWLRQNGRWRNAAWHSTSVSAP
jgi:hypothetical protein